MSSTRQRGLRLRKWRKAQKPRVTIKGLGNAIGDTNGWGVVKFETGEREFPLWVAANLCEHAELPLAAILSDEQMRLTRQLSALMVRDAAA